MTPARLKSYQVRVTTSWLARAVLFCGPVLRHVPLQCVRHVALWIVRRGIRINGERMDRVCDRLRV
jgi:hypothetical protein